MRNVDTLIIGAGVSGLTYGNHCKESYLIVEKEAEPGGLCRTFYQGEYTWDFAGHFFHFATEEMRHFFEERISKQEMVRCEKNTKIYYKEKYIDYPFQMNIHQLPQEEFWECLYDLHYREKKPLYDDFASMLYGKFGKSITEKFLKPYNEKLYACQLNQLDTDAMGRFFPYASEVDIVCNAVEGKAKSYNDIFEYPKKGAKKFIDVLMQGMDQDRLMLNTSVTEVDIKKRRATLSNGERVTYKNLVNTMSLDGFARLVGEDTTEIDTLLSANKVCVLNLGFDKPPLDDSLHWIYYPEDKYSFYRVGFYNNILKTKNMSLYVEVGYKTEDEIEENLLEKVLEDLKACGIVSNHQLQAYNQLEMKPAYVHITKESNAYVNRLKNKWMEHNVYTIGRYGGWKYCSIEDCMIEAIKLSKEIP